MVTISEYDSYDSYLWGFSTVLVNWNLAGMDGNRLNAWEPKGLGKTRCFVEGGLEHLVLVLLLHQWQLDDGDWESILLWETNRLENV